MKSCCFTGHRILKSSNELEKLTSEIIELSIKNGAESFYAGGAIGWDMLCEKAIIRLRSSYPQIKLHMILPCPEAEQTAKWTEKQKIEYKEILKNADSIEVLSEYYYDGCMMQRNKRLVELADICICFCNENTHIGGTAQTVRMAQSKGIPIINVWNLQNSDDIALMLKNC